MFVPSKKIRGFYLSFLHVKVENFSLFPGDGDGSQSQSSLEDFLSLDMKGKVIEAVFLPTYSDNKNSIRIYRVSQRLQVCFTCLDLMASHLTPVLFVVSITCIKSLI